jgi:hypothetical protein
MGYLENTEYVNAMFQTARCLAEDDVGLEVEDALDEDGEGGAFHGIESRRGF